MTAACLFDASMSLSILLKLLILPIYLLLPFTLGWAGRTDLWPLPFLIWAGLIAVNGLAEYLRGRR